MMTSRSIICLLENQNGGKLQKIHYDIHPVVLVNASIDIVKRLFNH
jgi:hypothetical protein